MRFINFCITCHQTALSTPQFPQLPDKKAVAEFAYLALITRSVSSVINGEGGGGGEELGEAIEFSLLCL